jgi:plastocyanin
LKRALAIGIVAGALALPASASAAITIGVTDDRYVPQVTGAEVGAGPTFAWNWIGLHGEPTTLDEHNVVSDDALFTSGEAGQTSGSFAVSASAGTFPYHCTFHDLQGMVGTVAVTPVVTDLTSKSFRVTWGNDGTTTGNRFDVKYRVDGKKKFKPWLKKTKKSSRVFGKKKNPVKVKPGHDYEIEVRSLRKKHKSGYSPPLPVTTPTS